MTLTDVFGATGTASQFPTDHRQPRGTSFWDAEEVHRAPGRTAECAQVEGQGVASGPVACKDAPGMGPSQSDRVLTGGHIKVQKRLHIPLVVYY